MTTDLSVSDSALAEQALAPELSPGERLVWSGRPAQGIRFQAGDLFMVPFSLLWAGFACFWEWSVISHGAPLLFVLWGIPFVLVGTYIVAGRFVADAALRARTFYGLTERRAIIITGLLNRTTKSVPLATLSDFSFVERRGGSGSIVLGTAAPFAAMLGGTSWPGMQSRLPPTFVQVDDARRVYEQLRELHQRGGRKG
jgi:hypothetical protein